MDSVSHSAAQSANARSEHAPIVEMKGVWKIFGALERRAVEAVRNEHLDKQTIAEKFHCVVGVADVSLSVARGEIFCIIGLSGSGKSTLIRHINRLLEPSLGEIFVNGENIVSKSQAELRAVRARHIGMVFQGFGLLPHRSVRDNVALPLEIRAIDKHERYALVEDALAKVNLTGWGDRYCHELSGGMQQRVGLARALAADTPILLMDEPFSALDPLIRRQLQEEFVMLSRSMGKTVIFITHDLEEAVRIGDRIAIMRDGMIVQTGTAEEVVTNPRDEYVARFVADISRLNLVTARSIMVPVEGGGPRPSTAEGAVTRVDAQDKISDLIVAATRHSRPLAVSDDQGNIIGLIDKDMLMAGFERERRK